MTRKKKLLILPKLNDHGGDLNKSWYVEYSVRDPRTGEMHRERVKEGFSKITTKAARYAHAEQLMADIREKIASGNLPFLPQKETYHDELLYAQTARRWGAERTDVRSIHYYLSEFIAMKKKSIREHSVSRYASYLRVFGEWAGRNDLEKKHISFVTRDDILRFITFIADEQHASEGTVKKYERMLHMLFAWLCKIRVVDRNPVEDIPRMGAEVDNAAVPIPDHDREVLRLYMQEKDPQLWLVCLMEYYCAIRPGEIRELRVGDVSLESGTIRVPGNVSKNRRSETIDIPEQLLKVLQEEWELAKYPPEWYIFSRDGMPGTQMVGRGRFRTRFLKIIKELGMPTRYRLYSFKHTGAVKLVDAGVGIWELQQHFRHTSITTTEQYIRKRIGQRSEMIRKHFPDI
jgi:integrase